MFVVLDSSTLCQDIMLRGSIARVFFANVDIVPATVAVPEVVIDEVTNQFRERLIKAQQELKRARAEVYGLLQKPNAVSESSVLEQDVDEYRQFLVNHVSSARGRLLPYPKVAHEIVVQRELQRKRPFKNNGSGYRDLLIWESLRQLTYSGHERVAFVTANTRDFGSSDKLHEDFRADILNPERIELFTSLKAFNEKHILPRLGEVDRFHQSLALLPPTTPAVAAWIRGSLLDILRNEDLGVLVTGAESGRFYASSIVSFDGIEASSVRRMSNDELVCEVAVRTAVDVSIDIEEGAYYNDGALREWLGRPISGSWNEVFNFVVHLEIIVDPNTGEVSSDDVMSVEVS